MKHTLLEIAAFLAIFAAAYVLGLAALKAVGEPPQPPPWNVEICPACGRPHR